MLWEWRPYNRENSAALASTYCKCSGFCRVPHNIMCQSAHDFGLLQTTLVAFLTYKQAVWILIWQRMCGLRALRKQLYYCTCSHNRSYSIYTHTCKEMLRRNQRDEARCRGQRGDQSFSATSYYLCGSQPNSHRATGKHLPEETRNARLLILSVHTHWGHFSGSLDYRYRHFFFVKKKKHIQLLSAKFSAPYESDIFLCFARGI